MYQTWFLSFFIEYAILGHPPVDLRIVFVIMKNICSSFIFSTQHNTWTFLSWTPYYIIHESVNIHILKARHVMKEFLGIFHTNHTKLCQVTSVHVLMLSYTSFIIYTSFRLLLVLKSTYFHWGSCKGKDSYDDKVLFFC